MIKKIYSWSKGASRVVGIGLLCSALATRLELIPWRDYVTAQAVDALGGARHEIPRERLPNLSHTIDHVLLRFQAVEPELSRKVARVYVVDSLDANAFALPNGDIVLTIGILARASSIDQVAGVLGHEVSHLLQDHYSKQLSLLTGSMGAAFLAFGTLGIVTLPITVPLWYLTNQFMQRQREYGADEGSVKLLEAAGFNPDSFGSFLGVQMARGYRYHPPLDDLKELTSSHPIIYKRALRVLSN